MFGLGSNQITAVGFKALLKTIKTHLTQLQLLELNIASNQIRIDDSFEPFFDFSALIHLKNLDLNFGYTDIQPEFLVNMFRNIARATAISTLSINLECTRIIPLHFGRAAKQLHSLQKVRELTLNISNNAMREEGIYAVADICLSMPSLTTLQLYFRKYPLVLFSAEVSDKGFIEFLKTISKIESLRSLKVNLMNNEITEKSMKTGSPHLENLINLEGLDLNLSNNRLSDFSFKYLCNSLLSLKTMVRLRLVLDTCSLTEKGCHYIGRLISQEPRL